MLTLLRRFCSRRLQGSSQLLNRAMCPVSHSTSLPSPPSCTAWVRTAIRCDSVPCNMPSSSSFSSAYSKPCVHVPSALFPFSLFPRFCCVCACQCTHDTYGCRDGLTVASAFLPHLHVHNKLNFVNYTQDNGGGLGLNVINNTYDFQDSIAEEGGPSNSLPYVLGAHPSTGFHFGVGGVVPCMRSIISRGCG